MGVSEWTCPECGAVHKRDINAAINIRNEGKRIFMEYFREWLEEDKKSRDRAEAKHKARVNKKKVTVAA
ncbi:MAG: transposase [Erysipelotrichaceae bacterium]|nr:transposase [Erysipelotrichaceae bacterium]